MSFSRLLRNGALAGATAGLLSAVVMWLHTEPVIRRALVIEEARRHLDGGHHHDEIVSRTAQVVFGAGTAALAGVLFGLVFAVVFARTRHRLPGVTDHARALWLAAFGFGVFVLLPALAVPANPPAVGDPGTVTRRTLIYVLAILVGLLVVRVLARGAAAAVPAHTDPHRHVRASAASRAGASRRTDSSPNIVPRTAHMVASWTSDATRKSQISAAGTSAGMVSGLLSVRQEAPAREAALART